jgi:hypothetical protein
MIEPSMKENIDVRYMKVWRRKERQEEKVNKEQVPEIVGFTVVRERREEEKEHAQEVVLSGIVVQDHKESTGKKEEVRVKEDDESTDGEEDYSTLGKDSSIVLSHLAWRLPTL